MKRNKLRIVVISLTFAMVFLTVSKWSLAKSEDEVEIFESLGVHALSEDYEAGLTTPSAITHDTYLPEKDDTGFETVITVNTDMDPVPEIQEALDGDEYSRITIMGSFPTTNKTIELEIPSEKTLVWKAELQGSITSGFILRIIGDGTFQMEDGSIQNEGGSGIEFWGSTNGIIISGGNIRGKGVGMSINGNRGVCETEFSMDGGSVESFGDNDYAIKNESNRSIEISGGIIRSSGAEGVGISSTYDTGANISGVTIEANSKAINVKGSLVINGGTLKSNGMTVHSESSITVNGGDIRSTASDGTAIHTRNSLVVNNGTIISGKFGIDGGSVTINGGEIHGDIFSVYSYGDIKIKGGTITSNNTGIEGSTVTVEDATIRTKGTAIMGKTIRVESGLITADATAHSDFMLPAISGKDKVVINGGLVQAKKVAIFGGEVVINDGLIESGTTAVISSGTVKFNGGIIISEKDGIRSLSKNIELNGGHLEVKGTGVSTQNADVIVNDIILISKGDGISNNRGNIILNGGRIEAAGTGIITGSADVVVNNIIITTTGDGIYNDSGNTLLYGVRIEALEVGIKTFIGDVVVNDVIIVTAGGIGIDTGRGNLVINPPGTVIGWNKPEGSAIYGKGTTTDLVVIPEGSARWSSLNGSSGISYSNGEFLPMDDVVVASVVASVDDLDNLRLLQNFDGLLTYTLEGGSFKEEVPLENFYPSVMPTWMSIDGAERINDTNLRVYLSGTPSNPGEFDLVLPSDISADTIVDGRSHIMIPVEALNLSGDVSKLEGASLTGPIIGTTSVSAISIEPVCTPTNGQRVEYLLSMDDSMSPVSVWQEETTFSGLAANTKYYIFARSRENETYFSGKPIQGEFMTKKIPAVDDTPPEEDDTPPEEDDTPPEEDDEPSDDVIPGDDTPPPEDDDNSSNERKNNKKKNPTPSVGTKIEGAEGSYTTIIDNNAIASMIENIQKASEMQVPLVLDLGFPNEADSIIAILTSSSLKSIIESKASGLEIKGGPITINIDQRSLQEILKQSKGNISISITKAISLSQQARDLIGDRPVYNFSIVSADREVNKSISNFEEGLVRISLSYTPRNNETLSNLFGVYISETGIPMRVEGSFYDSGTGSIIISTNHFSLFGVGYEDGIERFSDIGNHWAKESIDYIFGQGILKGTSDTKFSPNSPMTRGMFVTALGRMSGIDPSNFKSNGFTDVNNTSTFQPFIQWAYEMGIVRGVGQGKFEPSRPISREEMAIILSNHARVSGVYLPTLHSEMVFDDSGTIGEPYRIAVETMYRSGLIRGDVENMFNPKSSLTRGEAATILHRYKILY